MIIADKVIERDKGGRGRCQHPGWLLLNNPAWQCVVSISVQRGFGSSRLATESRDSGIAGILYENGD